MRFQHTKCVVSRCRHGLQVAEIRRCWLLFLRGFLIATQPCRSIPMGFEFRWQTHWNANSSVDLVFPINRGKNSMRENFPSSTRNQNSFGLIWFRIPRIWVRFLFLFGGASAKNRWRNAGKSVLICSISKWWKLIDQALSIFIAKALYRKNRKRDAARPLFYIQIEFGGVWIMSDYVNGSFHF